MQSNKDPNKPGKKRSTISRREFSRTIALAAATAATAAIPPGTTAKPPAEPPMSLDSPQDQTQGLSPVAQAQVQIIFAKYGGRLDDEQKADVKRLIAAAQKTSDDLHAFHLENSDEPAMIYTARLAEG